MKEYNKTCLFFILITLFSIQTAVARKKNVVIPESSYRAILNRLDIL